MKENNLPLVSIVVPCYNHEKYVTETIESIVNQTYKNIELIVIDDGSKDDSVKIIEQLANKYNFTFIHRPNKGLSATLNEGIRASNGKYFCGCASDDIYMLDKVEKQVNYMEKHPEYAMCYGNIIKFDSIKEEKIKALTASSGDMFDNLLCAKTVIPAVTYMIKTDVLKHLGGYDETLWVEDLDMWLRISHQYKIAYMDDYLAYYRRHETNISQQTLKMYQAQKDILEKWKYHDTYLTAMTYWKIDWCNRLARKHKRESLKYLLFSLKYIFNDTRVIKAIVKLVLK